MKRFAFAGVAVAALVAIPALAQMGGERRARMAEPMTRAAVQAQVQAKFAKVDIDRDGFVTRAEAEARVAAARGEHEARRGERRGRMFDRLDADRNGSISRAEFDDAAAARGEHRGEGRRAMHRGRVVRAGLGFGPGMFERLDADHDNRISLAEASARALAMFDKADADRNGTVTVEERRAAWQTFREQHRGRRGG
jgi:Ca2+-binding EF-hand superfamily protein